MFRASSLPIIRIFFYCTFDIGKFHAGFDDRFQAESGWLSSMSSILTLPGSGIQNLRETYQCRMYSRKNPDDEHRRCPKHVEFYNRIKLGKLVRLFGYLKRNQRFLQHSSHPRFKTPKYIITFTSPPPFSQHTLTSTSSVSADWHSAQ